MRSSEQINEVSAALAKAQADFPPIQKTKTARVKMKSGGEYTFDYADLPGIMDAIRPVLAANGLAVSQAVDTIDSKPMLESRVLHSSGQWLGSLWALAVGGSPQERGSELTYARRYALCGLLGIAADEDDDGNAATGNRANVAERQLRQQQQQKPQPMDLTDDHAFKGSVMNALIRRTFKDADVQKRVVTGALKSAGFANVTDIPAERRKGFISAIDAGTFDNFAKAPEAEPEKSDSKAEEPKPETAPPANYSKQVYAAIGERCGVKVPAVYDVARKIAKAAGANDIRSIVPSEQPKFIADIKAGKYDNLMPEKAQTETAGAA